MREPDEVPAAGPLKSPPAQRGYAVPTTRMEGRLAKVLADITCAERVSVDSHFFNDLAADSLVMAHFCARVRKQADLPSVSMKDVYQHPTVRSLATTLADAEPAPVQPRVPASAETAGPARAGTPQYLLCGALQFLIFLGYTCLTALVIAGGYEWITAGSDLLDNYLRAVLFGCVTFLGLCALPILVKWTLIGRWRRQQIRVWSLAYLRLWFVKTLIHANPLILFHGSPLYVLYLRALGAKIGRDVVILSRHVPLCTDLLTIGDRTVIRKDSYFACYRAHAGWIETGPVTLGKDVLISELTVLDIETSLGDGAQLGHASSLHTRQAVPDGERWHGSPAQRAEADYRAAGLTGGATRSKVVYVLLQLLTLLVVSVPLTIGGANLLIAELPQFTALMASESLTLTSWMFHLHALATSFALFFGSMLLGLLFLATVPRLLSLAIKPDRSYPLYGIRYSIHRTIAAVTNSKFFARLFGDSSYIVHYMRGLGYDLCQVEQTGSNFGTEMKHETPYLSRIGTGTMVADGLTIMNAEFSSTSFRVSQVAIGPHNFLGNDVAYPPRGKTGDNCLLATKVMIPIDGHVREGVGLLGSPSFEIPRSVERDASFDHLKEGDELRRHLGAKNKYNVRTMGLFLLAQWIYTFCLLLLAWGTADLYPSLGASVIAVATLLITLFTMVYSVFVERAVTLFRRQSPRFCSIYHPYFWRHERFWKFAATPAHFLNGTPFKSLLWRALGARLGRRVFDDGCAMPERTLVTIGDDCTLNAGSVIQCHSQEDGTFKSDRITIGAGCTLGIASLVHYGVTFGDGAVLAPDSFLMKGEEVPQHALWGGNPAKEIANRPAPAASG